MVECFLSSAYNTVNLGLRKRNFFGNPSTIS